MDIYKIHTVQELIPTNTYWGRGIITGTSADDNWAVNAYFIMGRSANSRNRIFEKRDGILYTAPYDPSKVQDPSLIIYPALREYKNCLIVTNGDHTNTVYNGLKKRLSLQTSLEERTFEPDAPNFTPRISSLCRFEDGSFRYEMSILKSIDSTGSGCARYAFSYPSKPGLGHFIHTYLQDGDPIPSFNGEPERIAIPNSMEEFADTLWQALNPDNKISLYVRYTQLSTGEMTETIINKNRSEV